MSSQLYHQLKKIGLFIVVFLLLCSLALVIYSNRDLYAKVTGLTDQIFSYGQYNTTIDFTNPHYFAYDVSKLKVNRKGATLLNNTDTANIILINPVKIDSGAKLVGFKEIADKGQDTKITYQVTSDYQAWQYWDGQKWTAVTENCTDCSNNAVEVAKNIKKFAVKADGLQVKAFLASKNSAVTLKSVELEIRGKKVLTDKEKRQMFFTKAIFAGHDDEEKVTICHRTASDSNPYEILEVDASAVDGEGANDHTSHTVDSNHNYGDIIPITDVNNDGNITEADCLANCTNICHHKSNKPNETETLCVASTDVQPHLGHGDTQGACGASQPVCGNGQVEQGEECDDNNTANGDGCSADCSFEPAVCGNGVIENEESCDYQASPSGCSQNQICNNQCACVTGTCSEYCQTLDYAQGTCRHNSCSNGETYETGGNVFCQNNYKCCCASGEPQPVPNPTLPKSCGLDIVLVLDSSDSIDNSELQQVRNAANAFVTSLSGTPTKFGVVDFDTQIVHTLALTNNISAVQSAINGIGHNNSTELTNWEAALKAGQGLFAAGSASKPNLMVIITDGDPTTYGYPTSQGDYGGTEPDAPDINNAITAANAAKSAGTRILAIGVTSAPTIANLVSISGPSVNSGTINADVITTDFSALFSELADYAQTLCGGTITVNKYINGTAIRGRQGWTFNVAGTSKTTDINGQTIAVDVSSGSNYSVIESNVLSGYNYVSASCQKQDGSPVGSVTEKGVNNISLSDQDIISCDFINNSICGDGISVYPEECDDGNTANGDGCSSQCTNEGPQPVCGNGQIDSGEECDFQAAETGCAENETCDQQCSCQVTEAKVQICHIPPGNPENAQTIWVNESAVPAHLEHGDYLGACIVWDKSNIEIDGECAGASAVFTLSNTGEPDISDMQGPSEYRVYRNGILEQTTSFQLDGGDNLQITVIAANDIIRVEADQRPGFPGNPLVTATVESCYQPVPPVVRDDSVTTLINTPVIIDILNNDTDLDGQLVPASVTITQSPANGNTSINTVTGEVTYTPNPGFYGQDNFTYQVCDNDNLCDTAVVTIKVLAPPQAVNDSATTTMNLPVDIAVLGNDSDLDGTLEKSTLKIITNPSNGTATVNTVTGAINYAPEYNFYGIDTFTYEICDNDNLCASASVSVLVQAPPIAVDDAASTDNNVPVDISVLTNDSDPDGNLVISTLKIVTPPNHGTTNINTSTGSILYIPDDGYVGLDSFVYEICDNDGLCDQATVIIGVASKVPPIAIEDVAATKFNTAVIIDILSNDYDIDGTLVKSSVSITTNPNNGNLSVNSATGAVTYTPNSGFYGLDSFTYQVCDNDGLCDTAEVHITVNTPPTAVDDTAVTTVNTPIEIDILANDSDPDGILDPSSVLVTQTPGHGIVSVNTETGKVIYTPNNGYLGNDQFEYLVCDNDGDCDKAEVTITVNRALLPPIANDDRASTTVNRSVDINILANDSDPDGNLVPSTVKIIVAPEHGQAFVDPQTGKVTYTPATNYQGTDNFTYEVCDDSNLCASANVTIIITGGGGPGQTNNPPDARDDGASTQMNVPVVIDVLANDSDPDNNLDKGSLVIITPPEHGTVSVDLNTGLVTYTPNTGYVGKDTFVYKICDTEGACDTAVVAINVTTGGGPGTQPVCGNQIVETGEDCDDGNITNGDGCSATCKLEVTPPPPPPPSGPTCGNGTLDAGEECDDNNILNGDGCSVNCLIETTTPPLVVPAAVLPTPPLPPVSPALSLNCTVPVYNTASITIVGSLGVPSTRISTLQFSSTNGASWNNIANYNTSGATTFFNINLFELETGTYTLIAKATYTDGTTISSASCPFSISGDLIFGANQFITPTE